MPEALRRATPSANGNGFSRSLLRDMVDNATLARSELMKRYFDPRRNLNDECGYPETDKIRGEDYRDLYNRDPIAARIVEILPRESWMLDPSVIEDEDSENITRFEGAFYDLGQSIESDESWYEDEQENPVWSYLLRADILSRIGWYGVLLLGIDDGKDLSEEASPGNNKLIYLRPFDCTMATVNRWETDDSNPRFGWPTEYNITFVDPKGTIPYHNTKSDTLRVHWSRCIHICGKNASSNVMHIPAMQPVLNRILDLRKTYGGSAEMYWRGAFPGISFEVIPQLADKIGAIGSTKRAAMRSEIEQYMNGLQRHLALTGLSAKSLPTQVVDPTAQIEVQLTAICILLDIPKRIFMGSERGELSSSQDAVDWLRNLSTVQRRHNTPDLIVPFVNRCIKLGILPEPKGKYKVTWPNMLELSADQQAVIAEKRIKAMASYIGGNVEALMAPIDLLTRELGYDASEATQILETAIEEMPEPEPMPQQIPPPQESVPGEEQPLPQKITPEQVQQVANISSTAISSRGVSSSDISRWATSNALSTELLLGILAELRNMRGEATMGYRPEKYGGKVPDEGNAEDRREAIQARFEDARPPTSMFNPRPPKGGQTYGLATRTSLLNAMPIKSVDDLDKVVKFIEAVLQEREVRA